MRTISVLNSKVFMVLMIRSRSIYDSSNSIRSRIRNWQCTYAPPVIMLGVNTTGGKLVVLEPVQLALQEYRTKYRHPDLPDFQCISLSALFPEAGALHCRIAVACNMAAL